MNRALLFAVLVLVPATALATGAGDPEPWHIRVPDQPAVVIVKNATIWTSGPQGRLEHADLLVEKGKIVKVGTGLSAPKGAVIVDAQGKHVTPGIIDEHSHSCIVGDVNEGTHNVTAEVRIGRDQLGGDEHLSPAGRWRDLCE